MPKIKPPSVILDIQYRWDIWERVLLKIDPGADEFGCWEWTGWNSGNGYGKTSIDGVAAMAHRVVWSIFNGPIKPGFLLDHLCRNRCCVNPLHLEEVTVRENTHRGEAVLFTRNE